MIPTLKDVAELAGVSRSAVSRTFTEGASVSERMRRKVELAAQKLGYSPNALASSLTTGRTKLVGLVSNNFQNPIFLEVFDLFTKTLQQRGLSPLIVNLSDDCEPANSLVMLRQYSVDAVVVASSSLSAGFASAFNDSGIPVVHTFGRFDPLPKVHVVGIDNVECGRMAARTLISREYKSIGYLGCPKGSTSAQDRQSGFMAEVALHPTIKAKTRYSAGYSFEAGRNMMLEELSEKPAEAYFCGDDIISIGALSAIREHGLKPSKDIGIIGLNDMQMSGWQSFDLTTIRQPVKKIVQATVDLIEEIVLQPNRDPEALIFPCQIVERGTLRKK